MEAPIEETHHITIEKFPGAYLAMLMDNATNAKHTHGIGDTVPDALRDLERKANDNIAIVPVRLPDGSTYGICHSLMGG